MTKILIINPPYLKNYSRPSRSPAVAKSGTLYYPIFLSYLAGYLEKKNYEIKLIDCIAENLEFDDICGIIRSFIPEFIISDSSIPSGKKDSLFLDSVKSAFPSVFCALVGPYPTAYSNEIQNNNFKFDAFILREYEFSAGKLIELKYKTNLKTVYLNDSTGIFKNGTGNPEPANLDEIPFVSSVYKRSLNPKKYFYSAGLYPVVSILSSRGCPFKCSFCNLPHTFFLTAYRRRTVQNLIDEFEFIKRELPDIKEIWIEDDSFNADLNYVKTFCAEKIKANNRLKWTINFNPRVYDEETLSLLRKAGCRLLVIGYESGLNSNLDIINKNCSVKDYLELDKLIAKNKLKVHGCFIIGLPYDAKQNVYETFALSKKLRLDTVQFFPVMLNKNTPLYDLYKNGGWLKTEDSDFYCPDGLHQTNASLPDFSDRDIMATCAEFRKKFYLRTEYFFYKFFSVIFSWGELKRTVKSLIRFAKYLV
ncbi:MAG TPA: radical SAM protein [bacterium]|nr:radical SAM protein [bacterium]